MFLEDGDGQHEDSGQQPADADAAVGVDRVCHDRECRGRQMAKYRSREMATRVKQLAPTDTAGRKCDINDK